MGLTATARSIPGTLRQDVTPDWVTRHRLFTDEPLHLGGSDTGPAPHELFPAALAACVSTTLVRYALTKAWDLGPVTVDVDYDHRSIPRRFVIHVALTGDLAPSQLERLEKVAAACPLRRSIETGIELAELVELRHDHVLAEDVLRILLRGRDIFRKIGGDLSGRQQTVDPDQDGGQARGR